MLSLGRPRLHLRETGSTNERARELAAAGAPHGTLVTAGRQHAGRGRQGRTWVDQPGRALLLSVVVRELDPLLSLRAGLAVADVAGTTALVKWPNDVLLAGRKVAGILVEGRPQEGWAVIGIGVNVAVEPSALPAELRETAGTLGRGPEQLEATLEELLRALEVRLGEPPDVVVEALRERDALLGLPIRWAGGEGTGAGIDESGALLVTTPGGERLKLDAGEVHLEKPADAASIALRRRSPEELERGLAEMLYDGRRQWAADERDLMVALAPFHDCARRLGVDVVEVFDRAAATAPKSIGDIVRGFGRRTDITPRAFGFRVVDADDGPTYRRVG